MVRLLPLLVLVLAVVACTDDACRYDVDCDAGQQCVDGDCEALVLSSSDGTCLKDADCSVGELCWNQLCVDCFDCTAPIAPTTCPEPALRDLLVCTDHDPQACPCYAGEVAFHEKEETGGRLSCAGVVGIFSDRPRIVQDGCHLEALGGELSGDANGANDLRLRIAQLPNDTACTAEEDVWSDGADDPGRPAVRITCSPTCTFWMERFRRPPPEREVPDGSFVMGSAEGPGVAADERPEHLVDVTCFSIDRFEVTRGDWQECLGKGACGPPDLAAAGMDLAAFFDGANAERPMTFVTFEQAEQYCRFRDKQLPTEAEWERAARGSADEGSPWPWGGAAPWTPAGTPDCGLANVQGCGGEALPPTDAGDAATRARGASFFDVVDLAGNVREWTRDFYRPDVYAERAAAGGLRGAKNPEQERSHDGLRARVVRGGSFRSVATAPGLPPTDELRSSDRAFADESTTAADLGLRCVRYKPGVAR